MRTNRSFIIAALLGASATFALYAWFIVGPIVGGILEIILTALGLSRPLAGALSFPLSGLVLWIVIFAILMYIIRKHSPKRLLS